MSRILVVEDDEVLRNELIELLRNEGYTADKSVDKPILLISMVENVKGIGGSGYVVKKDATVLDEYFEG